MSAIIKFVFKRWPFGPYRRQRTAERNPGPIQERTLRRLLSKAANTEYGLKYDFAGILQQPDIVQAYQARVPLTTYEDIQPYMERMLRQEADILWPGKVPYGAISGGTTSYAKLYPIAKERLKDHREFGLTGTFYFLAEEGDASFLRGKMLTVGGTVQPSSEYPGLLTSELSGISAHAAQEKYGGKLPKCMAFSPSVLEGLSWDEKLNTIADLSMEQDIRCIFCPSSWILVLLHRMLERYEEKHGRRATVSEIWPNLRLIFMGATPLEPYLPKLQQLLGSAKVSFRELYGSTQGIMAFQSHGADSAMMLWLGGSVFFEFVRWDEHGQAHAKRYTAETVEKDVLYVPYVTTIGGFWSFLLDDVIRFESLRPLKLIIVGRMNEMLDSFGEGVLRLEVQRSLDIAAQSTGAVLTEYHLAPLPAEREHQHGHELVLEFKESPQELARFASAYDRALQEINPCYAKCRTQKGLAFPELVVVPAGTFHKWLNESDREVHSLTKIPRLRQDRKIIDQLLETANSLGSAVHTS